jgi:ubiquinone/menaquinone biosynthesis C-methylase UbiE
MTHEEHAPAPAGHTARCGSGAGVRSHAEERIIAHLRPRPGGRYLDVGCGTGEDAVALARRVVPGGLALGLDVNADALRGVPRGTTLPVTFLRGDAEALPFRDGAFNGVRAKRTLHHVQAPARALAEMVRVTRPGGRVIAFEPDWGTAAVSGADPAITRAVLAHWCATRLHGWLGRTLPDLFRTMGLIDIRVEPLTEHTTTRDPATDGLWEWLVRRAAERAASDGVITGKDAARWLADLDTAERTGRFFACLTFVLVSGRRPSAPRRWPGTGRRQSSARSRSAKEEGGGGRSP